MRSNKVVHHPGRDGELFSTAEDEIEALRSFRTNMVGFIAGWPMTTVPAGWLECNGASLLRADYPELFAVIGTAYGAADSTHFNLPNYKDYFLRGFDASGIDAASRTDRGDGTTGAAVGTKQDGAVSSHLHATGTLSVTNGSAVATGFTGGTANADFDGSGGSTFQRPIALTTSALSVAGSTATTGGNETRPKNITVKWCVFASP